MKRLLMNQTTHRFEKLNLVGIASKKGDYDQLKCSYCGLSGRSYKLGVIEVRPEKRAVPICPKAPKMDLPKQIRITKCHGNGPQFRNLAPDSVHDLVEPPPGYSHDPMGVWVQGVGEPVKVLFDEFEPVAD